MKRAKKKKPDVRRKFYLSEKQLEKAKTEVSEEVVVKTGMLYCAALAEKGWNEDDIVSLFETVSRYVRYIDDKLLAIKDVQNVIERKTCIVLKGKW